MPVVLSAARLLVPAGPGKQSCCTVQNGACRISVETSGYLCFQDSFQSFASGDRTSLEIFAAGLYRQSGGPEPTFLAGQLVGKAVAPGSLNRPRRASKLKASVVEGYHRSEGIGFGSNPPNDAHCRFAAGGSGMSRVSATASDVKVKVRLRGVSCDADDVQLCLTTSSRITTTDRCASPSGCTLVEVPDEPIGVVEPDVGCCRVTAKGTCSIDASLSRIDPLNPDKLSMGTFLGAGLQRITPIDGDDPLEDTWPAFVVGLFLP